MLYVAPTIAAWRLVYALSLVGGKLAVDRPTALSLVDEITATEIFSRGSQCSTP
jgi:hypothetical protein